MLDALGRRMVDLVGMLIEDILRSFLFFEGIDLEESGERGMLLLNFENWSQT
jgi:hypothetical protein